MDGPRLDLERQPSGSIQPDESQRHVMTWLRGWRRSLTVDPAVAPVNLTGRAGFEFGLGRFFVRRSKQRG